MKYFTFLLLALVACGDTGQSAVSLPLRAMGTGDGTTAAGAWQVTLTQAALGFGPLYFCATAAASADLCPSALAEYADSTTIDALSVTAQNLGSIDGIEGTIHSATYDFALSWLTRQSAAEATAGAPGGHSAHFEGSATDGVRTVNFIADVDIVPQTQGSRAVQGVRTSVELDDSVQALQLQMDPATWWKKIDFEELYNSGENPVLIINGSKAHSALVIAITASHPLQFVWQ